MQTSCLLDQCCGHGHRFSIWNWFKGGFGAWGEKLLAPLATKQLCASKHRRRSVLTSDLPFVLLWSVKPPQSHHPCSLSGDRWGMLWIRDALKKYMDCLVLPCQWVRKQSAGCERIISCSSFSSFFLFFFSILLCNKILFTRVTYLHWEILITNPIKLNSSVQIKSCWHLILSRDQIEWVYF